MVKKEDEKMIYILIFLIFLIYIVFLCVVVLFILSRDLNKTKSWKSIVDEIRAFLKHRGRMRVWAHLVKIIMFIPCIIVYYLFKYIKQIFIFLVYFK